MPAEAKSSDVSALVNTGPSANTQTKTDLEFNRKKLVCTDICCLVTFLIYMLGMVIIAGVALTTGSPDRLIYGTDYMGNTCAHGPNEKTTEDALKSIAGGDGMPMSAGTYWDEKTWVQFFKNRKAITYPRTNVDQLISKLTAFNVDNDVPTLPSFYGLCVNKCPVARPTESSTNDNDFFQNSLKMQHQDVVCSLSASAEIQRQCKSKAFQGEMATKFNNTRPDGSQRIPKGWTNDLLNDDTLLSVVRESICLTQFFDLCGDSAEANPEFCRAAGASNESLAAVRNDCWKQYINSVEIVNRCVATRSVKMTVTCTSPKKKIFGKRKPCTFSDCKQNSDSSSSGITGTCYEKDENGADVKMCPKKWNQTWTGAAQICAQCDFAANPNPMAFCPEVMGEPTCSENGPSFQCDVDGTKVTEFSKCPLPKKDDVDDTCLSCDFAGGKAFCPEVMGDPSCDKNSDSFNCDVAGTKVTSQAACSNYAFNGYRPYSTENWIITEYENSGAKQLTAEENAAAVNSSKNAPSEDGTKGISDPGYCASSYTTTTSAYGVKTSDLFDFLNGAGKVAAGWFADFEVTKTPILVTGIPLAILLAFSWIWFMKNFGKCVCWTTLVLSFLSCIALNLCLYVKAGIIGSAFLDMTSSLIAKANPELADQVPNSFPDYLQPSETRKSLYKWSAIAMTAFLLVCFLMMVRFRQKINVAIQMCKEAAAAIIDMPLLVFWPFVNVIFLTCFMVYFVYIAMYISSAANLQQLNVKLNDQYQSNMAKMTALGNDAIDAGNAGMGAAVKGYNGALAKIPEEATVNDPTGKLTSASATLDTGKIKAFTADDWNAVQHMSWNTTTVQPLEFSASKAIRGMLVYHTIGMWWGAMALVALGYFTISSAVSQWYFNTAKFLEQSKRAKSGKYSAKTNCLCCQVSFQQHIDSPVMEAMQTGCRFHCGSIACGSGLNIIVYFLKIAFLWINRLVSSISNDNVVARKIKACMFISMLAFDRYIRIITRNAYIMIAIRGKGFFQSSTWASWLIFAAQDNPKSLDTGSKKVVEAEKARKAFNTKQKKKIAELEKMKPAGESVFQSISFSNGKIIGLDDETKKEYTIATQQAKDRQLIREKEKLTSYEGPYKEQSYNAAQYAVLSLITDILLFLGKLVVVVMSGIASYAWIDAQYGPSTQTISSSAAPVAVSMLFSYFIASSFMSVYDMSIDTILLCFFYDKLQNKGGPYAMSPTLKKLVIANLPPGVDKTNMRKGDSFFFSQMVTEQGSIALGAGWDAESKPDADSGKVVKQDVDLALAIFNHDAQLLDYIGYMDCPAFNGVQGGMLLKKTTGGKLFPNRKDGTVSHLNKECVKWSGDDTTGAKSSQNVAGINEDITVRLHEMPQAVNTLAFMLFSFKGPTMDKISDLRLIATECTSSDADPSKPRFPEVVAKFNMDFDESTMEGMQRAMLCATLRRNPGPRFPDGKHTFSAEQKTWVDRFCVAPVEKARQACSNPQKYKSPAELDNFVEHARLFAEPCYGEMSLNDDLVNEVKGKIDCMFEGEMDHLLSLPQKDKTRKLQKQLAALENKKAKFVMYHLFAMGSEKTLGKGKGLSAHQIMVYTNTYSKHHKTGDQLSPDENIFDCAWELQAQRELMASKKFDASILNNIARKCFFFRTAADKFKEAEGSFIGGAVAAGAAFMVGA